MIRSMTAFARAETTAPWGSAQWELRSVNNRYLDVSPRIAEDLRSLETAVRERIVAGDGAGALELIRRSTP